MITIYPQRQNSKNIFSLFIKTKSGFEIGLYLMHKNINQNYFLIE